MSGKPLKIPRYLCHLSGPTISGFYNISLSLLSFLPPFPVPVPPSSLFQPFEMAIYRLSVPDSLDHCPLEAGRQERGGFASLLASIITKGWTDGWMAFALTLTVQTLAQDRRGRSRSPPLTLRFSGRASECTLATVILELLRRFISPLVSPSLANPLGGRRESGQTSWLFVTLMPQSAIRISGAVITTSTSQAKGII